MPTNVTPPRRLPLSLLTGALLVIVLCAWGWRLSLPSGDEANAGPAVRVLPAPPASLSGSPLPSANITHPVIPASAGSSINSYEAPAAAVQPRQLSNTRPQWAEAFLREVQVLPAARGGFIVQSVEPESRWHRLGLRRGDVIYTLDTPAMAAVDENSMVALMQQTTMDIEVYRAGMLLHLQLPLTRDPADEAPPDAPGRIAS